MPNNFINALSYIRATSRFIALFVTIIVCGVAIVVFVFSYIYIPLLAFAGLRWLRQHHHKEKTMTVEFIEKKETDKKND